MEILASLTFACYKCLKTETKDSRQTDFEIIANDLKTRVVVLESKLQNVADRVKNIDSRTSCCTDNDIDKKDRILKDIFTIEKNIAVLEKCIEDVISRRSVESSLNHINEMLTMQLENTSRNLNYMHETHKEQVTKDITKISENISSVGRELKDIKKTAYFKLESLEKKIDHLAYQFKDNSETVALPMISLNSRRNTFTGV